MTSWRHELAIVAPVAVIGQFDVWWISASSAGLQAQTLEAIGVLAFAVALLFRHRAPQAVLVFMGALSCAEALLVERRAFFFGQLVPYVIALAAAAAVSRGSQRFSTLALAIAAFAPLVALVHELQGAGNIATYAVVLPGAWGIGLMLGDRAQRADSMELLANLREQEAKDAVAAERARIARELHDVVAHNVGIIVLHTVAARAAARGERSSAAVHGPLDTIETTARETLEEMRRLVRLLDDHQQPAIAPAKLANLDALLERIRGAGLKVELTIEGEPRPLPAAIDLSAYRIVQESLTNALKHAGRASVQVRLAYRTREVSIDVVDDGAGSSERADTGGRGLAGMRERVALFNGTLDAGPRAEGGFQVHAELPVPA
ncbi:MAG TPA: histidine kinase [Gaiellaceae bacterium]|nr:histidine kinase [Gaiellaceae bacterium]